jgi:hypothetical protein
MAYSGHALLPHLNVLQEHFLKPLTDNDERFCSTYFDLELLPYAMGATRYALSEFARLQREIVAEFSAERLEGLAFFGLSPDQRDLLSYMLDNFLDSARRAQDAVIHYLSRGLKVSLPSSMHALVQKLRNGSIVLPERPQQEILKYWDAHGQRLKDYRDLSQHHALVASDARIIRSDDGRVGVYLLLPSNPEVKNTGRLIFGSPNIHAFPYAKRQFKVLLVFSDWLTKGLLPKPEQRRQLLLTTIFRDPPKVGGGVYEAYVPPTEEALRTEVEVLLKHLKASN